MEPDREAWHVLADEIAAMLADLITHREDRIQEDHNRETARGYSPGRFQVGRQKGYCRALARRNCTRNAWRVRRSEDLAPRPTTNIFSFRRGISGPGNTRGRHSGVAKSAGTREDGHPEPGVRRPVNREIGHGAADAGGGGVTINFISNVRPEKLLATRSRALPP
jgi:hypothetical protein